MISTLRNFFQTLLDIVAPPRGTEARVRTTTLDDLHYLAAGESALPYKEKVITALVWELKYRANPRAAALAGAFLAEELMATAAEELGKPLLIPTPMHSARRRERGYNQTELMCEAVLQALARNETARENSLVEAVGRPEDFFKGSFVEGPFEYAPHLLTRVRATPPQQGLPKHERLKNIKNSMRVASPERVRGRACVVVDDVTTTGATFAECRRALKQAGARAVYCVALARS